MKQKVWFVFDEPHWAEVPEKGETVAPAAADMPAAGQAPGDPAPKNPAVSFSLSMVIWGSGHFYSRAYVFSALWLLGMLLFYAPLFAMLFFRDAAGRLLAEFGIPASILMAGVVGYLGIGMVCWLANAIQAYHRAMRLRSGAFLGVDKEYWPPLCSLLFPGWGQFLNGQPGKGLFYLCWGGLGILVAGSLGIFWYVWPDLQATPAAHSLEICLIAALLLIPLVLLVWVVSAFDAFVTYKALLIDKLRKHPNADQTRKGLTARHIFPRWNAVLVLLLVMSVGNQIFPRAYYLDALERLRGVTLSYHLEIIPDLIGKVLAMIG